MFRLSNKTWAEICVLGGSVVVLSVILASQAIQIGTLNEQLDARDARVDAYFRYVEDRDQVWGPHILAIPVEP